MFFSRLVFGWDVKLDCIASWSSPFSCTYFVWLCGFCRRAFHDGSSPVHCSRFVCILVRIAISSLGSERAGLYASHATFVCRACSTLSLSLLLLGVWGWLAADCDWSTPWTFHLTCIDKTWYIHGQWVDVLCLTEIMLLLRMRHLLEGGFLRITTLWHSFIQILSCHYLVFL